ncbi:VOC family protein [Acinetobacter tianfuensis]|uniref:VOC family protein n=1 Tax=Acinetobacter tianfuensis TaxID=2419603 RepID=A0A3A8E529_9GAMM|nr:VOC family protein [Acinetobacter tianfuensis]RKG30172.1 VOC family protein [Acinetobacter tianfuensis]
MNAVIYFEIQSSDPARDVQFYSTVFGWTFTLAEGLPIQYFQIQTSGINGGLLERPAQIPPVHCGTNAFTCSIEVENFDETAAKILANGGQVAMEKFAISGKCWQGYFLDPDHNTFGLVQVDEQAQ